MARDDPATLSARPTVRIGGQQLPLLSANIARFRMREALGGLSSLELSIYDILSFPDGSAGFGATAASPVALGAEIVVYVGDTWSPQTVFTGIITAIEAEAGPGTAPLFTILAEDRLFALRRTRKSRSFDDMTPADVVRAIASDHALQAEVGDGLDAPAATWVQMNESDLAFLRRLLAALDADCQLTDTRLQVVRRATAPRATVPLAIGDTLLKVRITADLAEQATETRVGSLDPATGEAVVAVASSGGMGPGSGTDGPAILQRVVSATREHVGHTGPMTDAHARALAEAAYGQRARGFVRADGTAQGNGAIRVGSWLGIAGVNPFFVNTYCVVEATHRFDLEGGYLTDFVAECAYLAAGA